MTALFSRGVRFIYLPLVGLGSNPTGRPRPARRACTTQTYALHGTLKERKKENDNPREGWEDGTPPPHRDFKERGVMR